MKRMLFIYLPVILIFFTIAGCINLPDYDSPSRYTLGDLQVDPDDARKEVLQGYKGYPGKVVKVSPSNGVNWVDYSRTVYWDWDLNANGFHELTISMSVMAEAPQSNRATISAYKPSRGIWRSSTEIEWKGPPNIGWTMQSGEENYSQFGGKPVEIPLGQWVDLKFTKVLDIDGNSNGQVFIDGHNDEQGLLDLTLYIRHFKVSLEKTDRSLIALTFDKAPSDMTHLILDKLEALDIKATFFLVGMNIDAINPATDKALSREERQTVSDERKETVQRMVEDGHEVANQSYSHNYMGGGKLNGTDGIDSHVQPRDIPVLLGYSVFSYPLNENVIAMEMEDTQIAIQKAVYGEDDYLDHPWVSRFFMAPFNIDPNTAANLKNAARNLGLPIIYGIGDVKPAGNAEQLAADIIEKAVPWGINICNISQTDESILEFLDIVFPKLKAEGYEFVTLSRMVEKRGRELTPGNVYQTMAPDLP